MPDASPTVSPLHLAVAGSDVPVVLRPGRLIVAGYTGRDQLAVQAHIDELAAIGIAPPPTVPMLYDLDPALATAESTIAVNPNSSGEVEPVFVRHRGDWFLGVGSDHTDRELERADIRASKAACAKPVGRNVIPLPAQLLDGTYDDAWDAGSMTCRVDGAPYQSGSLTSLRQPSDLLRRVTRALEDDAADDEDLVLFAGTVPLLEGGFRFGTDWQLELALPDYTLTHQYSTQ